MRVGGGNPVTLNVRFVLTALPEFIEQKNDVMFYKAFYDRVTLSYFLLAPLREKRSSVDLWTKVLLEEMGKEWGEELPELDKVAIKALQAYSWPGNVHELQAILLQTLLNLRGTKILLEDLPQNISRVFTLASQDGVGLFPNTLFSLPLKEARAIFEFNYLCAQIAAVEGSMTKAAEVVGMERSALHRKLKNLEQETKEVIIKLA